MFKFFIALAIAGLIAGGLTFFAFDQSWLSALPTFLYQTIIFLSFSTAVVYAYLHHIKRPDFFVQLYLLIMAVKILAYGVYVYWMITEDKDGSSLNVIFFLTLYFIFTGLEIGFLYAKISKQTLQE